MTGIRSLGTSRLAARAPRVATAPPHRNQGDEIAPLHVLPESSGDRILTPQSSTLIGLKPGIKTIAAVHNQCRRWVKNGVFSKGSYVSFRRQRTSGLFGYGRRSAKAGKLRNAPP